MKNTLSAYDIASALKNDDSANWSHDGAMALAELLEDTGNGEELDVVAIRGDFSESESLQGWIADYYGEPLHTALKSAGIEIEEDDEDDEIDELIRDYINDRGTLIEFSSGIIVSSF